MARSRIVKPEFWDDEKLSTVSRDARLTFIGMRTHSDDYGVVKGHHAWLKHHIFPYDEIKITEFQKWITELENIGVIMSYAVNGEKYYNIKNFTKHQTINRPSLAKNPSPPDTLTEHSLNIHGALTDETEVKEKVKEKVKDTHSQKISFGNILLTPEEHEKLKLKYNSHLEDILNFINLKVESKGISEWRKQYKSDYATILVWDRKGYLPESNKNSSRINHTDGMIDRALRGEI